MIADYVVAALKNLFTDADIRASSDRYLRNAIIAVLAYDRSSTLWDAARLLSVGEEGYSYRARVGARVRTMPEFKEISEFFTAELTAQLADARSTTTAKLDAPVNKLARLLNSPSIKRVLLERLAAGRLRPGDRRARRCSSSRARSAVMGAGNTSVLMQLLVGMLDAALARQQDLVPESERVAVALKVDEAPLVLNRGFAETMALKRSAGLETVACWQTDAQWIDREVRDQLDALFAHRVYFATASAEDARAAVELTMAEFSDTVRPGIEHLSALGRPDARLHLPKHHAIASWSTPEGRQAPFVAETIPLRVDPERLRVARRAPGASAAGRHRTDLRQPHWDRERRGTEDRDPERPDGRAGESDEKKDARTTEPNVDHVANAPVQGRGSRAPTQTTATRQQTSERGTPQPPSGGSHASTDVSPGKPTPAVQVPVVAHSQAGHRASTGSSALSKTPPDSYRELVDLDGAHSVRWAGVCSEPRIAGSRVARPGDSGARGEHAACAEHPDPPAIQRHARSHDHSAQARSACPTPVYSALSVSSPRRWGCPDVLRDHRRGSRVLHTHDRLTGLREDEVDAPSGSPSSAAPVEGERVLRQARHDVHVAGWALALERALDRASLGLRGARESVLSPPLLRAGNEGRVALGPGDLTLPGGRAPHEFLCTDATGARAQVERFETVRPDVTIELAGGLSDGAGVQAGPVEGSVVEREVVAGEHARDVSVVAAGGAIDLLVELDDRLPTGRAAGKLERYDHFMAGWSVHTRRYGLRGRATPLVVFVCRDRARARECARRADTVLSACRAYAGEYPADWEYPGRTGVLFVAERDAHEDLLCGYGVPRLPPDVRVSAAHGDPRAGAAAVEVRELFGAMR